CSLNPRFFGVNHYDHTFFIRQAANAFVTVYHPGPFRFLTGCEFGTRLNLLINTHTSESCRFENHKRYGGIAFSKINIVLYLLTGEVKSRLIFLAFNGISKDTYNEVFVQLLHDLQTFRPGFAAGKLFKKRIAHNALY